MHVLMRVDAKRLTLGQNAFPKRHLRFDLFADLLLEFIGMKQTQPEQSDKIVLERAVFIGKQSDFLWVGKAFALHKIDVKRKLSVFAVSYRIQIYFIKVRENADSVQYSQINTFLYMP